MKVKFYGTRGSVAVCGPDFNKYGGNTTCVQVSSLALPEDQLLVIDAGTGIVPLGMQALRDGIRNITILFSHFHHDHTGGLLLCPPLYSKEVRMNLYGPVEEGFGPREVMDHLMKSPFHPVVYQQVAAHVRTTQLEVPKSKVMIFHPEGGMKVISVDEFEMYEAEDPAQIKMGNGGVYPIAGCLVVRMLYTLHPERTISYRFEERPTGKVFVFLTDHENTDGLSMDMKQHLHGADLLVMDCQYSRKAYDNGRAGYGHGTPDYAVRVAIETGARRLGLTHHDPLSTDVNIDAILSEALKADKGRALREQIFACADYQTVEV